MALATFGKMNMIEIYAINASALSQFMSQYVRKEHARADRLFYFASKHCRVKKRKKKYFCEVKTFSRCMYTPASYGKNGKEAPKRDTKYQAARPKNCIYG